MAVPLPPETRRALDAHLRAAAPDGLPGRSIPPANWHFTLRFLGDTATETERAVRRELAAAPLGPPGEAYSDGYGAFPRPARATVLWLGVGEGAERLRQLASAVEEAVRRAGLPPGRRPFAPHLTLSRTRTPEDVRPLLEQLPPFSAPLPIREVVLYRSHLGGGPPRYEPVENFPLR